MPPEFSAGAGVTDSGLLFEWMKVHRRLSALLIALLT
jgi:hypothetical protein